MSCSAFFSSVAEAPGLDLLGFAKNLPGVVAGRIGLRRRGAELDRGIEHAVEQRRRRRPRGRAAPARTAGCARTAPQGRCASAAASACGCSMLAEANTSAFAPAAISSFSRPDAPNFACTLPRPAASKAFATSVSAARRLPAAWSKTVSSAIAGAVMIARTARAAESRARITRRNRWRSDRTTARR